MLRRITVHNLALIRDIDMEFCGQLNVLSGETGAGKSIIVDSLMLLIGGRYDKTMLKYGEDKGYVEGVFEVTDCASAEAVGVDCEDGLIIVTRRFYRDGKNEIRVNGKQVTTAMLREIMLSYVDIYGQNEYQSLLKLTEQRKILDHYVFGDELDAQRALYGEYRSVCAELSGLGDERERAQRADILRYQIDEIESAKVVKGEEEALVERRHVLMSSERIKTSLADAYRCIDGDGAISEAAHALSQISQFGESFAALGERLRSAAIELDDIAECIKDELDGMDSDERELDKIIARLDKLRALKSKYGGYDSMARFLDGAKAELARAENGAELYETLCKKRGEIRKKLYDSSVALSEKRRAGAKSLAGRIAAELADLGMENSRFEVKFSQMPDIDGMDKVVTADGFDSIEFYLSPNAGMPLLPLAKIISGGETSRFMLAIKLVTGDLGGIDTMIFDEVDTGISGAVGLSVAKKLCELSRTKQVLCVTHLAQIAAMADAHFYINKYEDGGNTVTRVTALDRAGQIEEISRLSGTKGVSEISDRNAAELKDFCDGYKASLNS